MKRLACLLLAACSSDPSVSPTPGACASATDTASATAALGAGNSCVSLSEGSYAGPFKVPAGVKLTARARATITGGSATEPAILLGEGASVSNLDVTGAVGVGIAVRGATAVVKDVTVTGSGSAGIAVRGGDLTIGSSTISNNKLGLWISGAHVMITAGSVSSNGGQSLSNGTGIVVQDGAKLDLDGTTVEKNEGTGILIDGAASTANVMNANVTDNGERGIWAQKIHGTIDLPALRVEKTNIMRNKVVGLGGLEARGIIIIGGLVSDTVAAPVVTNLATTESVGDGIGLFGGTTDVKIDADVKLSANPRAAALIDGVTTGGIIIIGGSVAAGASGLKVVVQNGATNIQVDAANTSTTTTPLGISAPQISVPTVLQ